MVDFLAELLCLGLGFIFALAAVAVVGYGLWTMFAGIVRPGSAPARDHIEEGKRRRRLIECAECSGRFPGDDEMCPYCGRANDRKHAQELDDLEAAARAMQRLKEQGKLSAKISEQVYRCIEARQNDLLARSPTERLEAWFGADFGAGMTIDQKKDALALAKALSDRERRKLSARALVGIARLQTAVGTLSRACDTYESLFECHPKSRISVAALVDALEVACKAADWLRAQVLVHIIRTMWMQIDETPRLRELIAMAEARGKVKPVAVVAPAETPRREGGAPAEPRTGKHVSVSVDAEASGSAGALPSPASAEPVTPRRSFAEWIAVFMEQRNILWGELIGGSLIIGCSIALVISLWDKLADIRYFPFLIFAAITSALFSAGFYTLHHWKLESTSRGMLLIGALLAPLNFSILAGLPAIDNPILDYVLGIVALGLFGWLLYRAAHILIQTPLEMPGPSALLITTAMLVSAAAQLATPIVLANADAEAAVGLTPVLALVAALGWMLLRLWPLDAWSVGRRSGLMIALGSTIFACGSTLGFLMFRSDALPTTLLKLAPALTLFGSPLLVAGIMLHRKLAGDSADEQVGLWRTLGTGIGLAGLCVMFAGFAAAVEDPLQRWLCGLLNAAVLLAVGWWLRLPMLHIPTQLYLGVLFVTGGTTDVRAVIETPDASLRLVALMALQAVGAEVFMRLQRPGDARIFAIGGSVTTALAIALSVTQALDHPGAAAFVQGAAVLVWLASNLRWRFGEITYACAAVLAAALFFALRHFNADGAVRVQILWALLIHATACLGVAIAIRPWSADWLRDAFRTPMQWAALIASVCAVGVVGVEMVRWSLPWSTAALACVWLAGLWLTLAALEGWPILFGGFQVALALAWLFAAGDRLTTLAWDWREPYSLHIYGVGLGVLCLTFELARLTLRKRERVIALLTPTFVPVDRVLAGGLVVSNYLLAAVLVLWNLGRELLDTPDMGRVFPLDWYDNAYSPWAWLFVLIQIGVLTVWLAKADLRSALIGLAIVALTIPLLAAGTWFDDTQASASATRWGLALVFALGSLLLWNRRRLAGTHIDAVPDVVLRVLFVGGAVAPALWISLIVVVRKLTGLPIAGPVGGIFADIGGPASLLIPLGLFSATLAGHGFRERLSIYLGAAGALANATCVGAFFLALQQLGIPFGQQRVAVDALLIAAGVAWTWSILWAAVASWLEKDDARPLLDSTLLTANSGIGATFFLAALVPALAFVIFGADDGGRLWTQAVGSPWTWLAFTSMAVGACVLAWKRHASVSLHQIGMLALAAVGVGTCTVEAIVPGQGFRTLMLACGGSACVWVWFTVFFDAAQPPHWLRVGKTLAESVLYACIAGTVATLLAATTLATEKDTIWSALAVALVAIAGVLLAYQRRAEIWMTLVTLLAMLAGTILVVHFDRADAQLALRLIQVNLSVIGISSLARLAFRRQLSAAGVGLGQLHLLGLQIAWGLLLNLILSAVLLADLVIHPDTPDEMLTRGGDWAGWLTLLTNALAAIWYVAEVRPRWVMHAVGLGGLMFGIALAGLATQVLAPFEWEWIGHHALTLCWTLLALGLLIVSWASHAQPALGPQLWSPERRTWLADLLRGWFPERTARTWVSVLGAFVVLLALRATAVQPDRPYWSIANTLAVSVLLATLAVWARTPAFLYGAGLLFNIIGLLVYTAWSAHRLNARGPLIANDEWLIAGVLAQIISFAVAAALCSLLERRLRTCGIELTDGFPFTQAALLAGVQLLAIGVGMANALHLAGVEVRFGHALAWISLGVLTAASLIEIWRPNFRRFTRYHLYTCGLTALGLLLHQMVLTPADWCRVAALLLAQYVLLIVIMRRVMDALPRFGEFLQLRPGVYGRGFWSVQVGNMAIVVCLSLGIALSGSSVAERLGGAVAAGLVMASALLLAGVWPHTDRNAQFAVVLRYFVLTLIPIIAIEVGWALLDGEQLRAIWLQRTAAAFAVIVATIAFLRYGLTRWLTGSTWLEPTRMFRTIVGVVGLLVLVTLLGQEFVRYDPDPGVRTTPLLLTLVIAAGIAIIGLTAIALHAALSPLPDVYRLEGQGRSTYVYVAEGLVFALIAHVRLNVPDLLPPALGRYWYLAVMVIAFAWLALAEIFARRQRTILASPLKVTSVVLAIVPVLAFRLGPIAAAGAFDPLRNAIPGVDPFLNYLKRLGDQNIFDVEALPMEAVCWLLLGIFLATWARLRDSANLGVVAALAVNFGVWVLLDRQGVTGFIQRPQLWLIPLGLIILVAEFVNRARLGFWPSLAVRYSGLVCIYLSSTIEMFMEGLGHPLFAIILALLAVSGVLLGILFRVRAFVLTGFLALLVVIFAQIWHAAVERGNTWVWYASGIVLGVMILLMFALFEKHRNEFAKVIDNMKRWH